jgi:Putative secretion activating protein
MATTILSNEAKTYIDRVIGQEGGWVLTSNKNDPDGGWTYAGVTARTFGKLLYDAGQQKYSGPADLNTFKESLRTESDLVSGSIYNIYYTEFWQPLHFDDVSFAGRGPLLSCAVNLGLDDAVFVLQRAINLLVEDVFKGILDYKEKLLKVDGHLGPKTVTMLKWAATESNTLFKTFLLQEWMRQYINLVQKNAEAWKKYAQALETGQANKSGEPATLRAANLEGWFNRVEYWRF